MADVETYDYVIVGAGAAGCVLSEKLTADGTNRVLTLEAGPMDRSLWIHIPAAYHKLFSGPMLNWNYETEEEPGAFDRKIFHPRGKVVGGSTSINAMIYMRGHPHDYDNWARDFDLPDWSYAHCLPYFKAGETSERGADDWRGDAGPMTTRQGKTQNPLYDALIEAADPSGHGLSHDLNGYRPEGLARLDRSVTPKGRRCSAAVAYLRPSLSRENFKLKTGAMVHKVVLQGNRAVGLEYVHGGQAHRVEVEKEVILSGGAMNSPQLLMLSGIGPSGHLREHGIDVQIDLAGVGQNLHDHPLVDLKYECTKPVTPHNLTNPFVKLKTGAQWMLTGTGLAASNMYEAGGLVRSNPDIDYPNIQIQLCSVGVEFTDSGIQLDQGFHMYQDLLRPTSRGELTLRSADLTDKVRLKFNYFATEEDRRNAVDGMRTTREIVAQKSFDHLRGKEIYPGKDKQSFEELDEAIRSKSETDFHPAGTCRMGNDSMAVVDGEMRVHGVEGLRVVDTSVMPRVTSGNTNAPTQMIAARAADFILGKPQRAPLNPGFHFNEQEV
jgi:choline dehydrogenase